MKTTEITFRVTVDENNLPQTISWEAPGAGETSNCKSMMVDEMKKFFHQNVVTLTDTYIKATGDETTGKKVKKFFSEIGKDIGVLQ